MTDYLIFHRRGKPVIAFPDGPPAVRRRHFDLFPVERGKRLATCALRAIDRLHAGRLVWRRSKEPLDGIGVPVRQFVDAVEEVLARRIQQVVFVWPPASRSDGRLYAYLLDDRAQCAGFCKVATGTADRSGLQREVEAARALASRCRAGAPCRVPQLLGAGSFGANADYGIWEPVPPDAVHIHFGAAAWEEFGQRCKRSFAGEAHAAAREVIEQQWWWQRYLEASAAAPRFQRRCLRALERPVDVVRTHGDFLGHNFRLARGEIWVFDWEEYTPCGPLLADEIGFFFCVHRYGLRRKPPEILRLYRRTYLETGDARRRDADLALAFLFGANIAFAREVVLHLEEEC